MLLFVASAELSGSQATQEAPASNATSQFDPNALPDVVARVNGQAISKAQLLSEARGAFLQLRQMGQAPAAVDEAFFRQVLDQLIAGTLIDEEAKAVGVAATEEEIEQNFEKAKAQHASEEEFKKSLEEQLTNEDVLRQDLRLEISRRKYLERSIGPSLEISDAEVQAAYEQNVESMKEPERVKARHILVQVGPEASPEQKEAARTRAERLLERVRGGEDFAAVAAESSDDPTKEQGGELPWIGRGQVRPEFEKVAFELEPGAISDIVETEIGLHIITVLEHVQERTVPFEEVKDRIRLVLLNQRAQARLIEKVQELMGKAEIERAL